MDLQRFQESGFPRTPLGFTQTSSPPPPKKTLNILPSYGTVMCLNGLHLTLYNLYNQGVGVLYQFGKDLSTECPVLLAV